MGPFLGQVALGLYAALLGAGGLMGYLKAGSKPSLVAGLVSAVLALACLAVLGSRPRLGYGLGAALAALLLGLFAARYAKGRKLMPSGMMALVSLVVLVLLAAGAIQAES